MKQTQCCKAGYNELVDTDKSIYGYQCKSCLRPCALEDAPAEGWEKLIYDIHSLHMDLAHKADICDIREDINKLVKSERELLKAEILEDIRKMDSTYDEAEAVQSLREIKDEIIRLIQSK